MPADEPDKRLDSDGDGSHPPAGPGHHWRPGSPPRPPQDGPPPGPPGADDSRGRGRHPRPGAEGPHSQEGPPPGPPGHGPYPGGPQQVPIRLPPPPARDPLTGTRRAGRPEGGPPFGRPDLGAARSARRPGQRPGAPAELFVETTSETPALRDVPLGRDRHAEPPPEPGADPGAEPLPPRADPHPRSRERRLKAAKAGRGTTKAEPDGGAAAAGTAGHGHGHGHTPAPPAGRRVRILIAALLVPCALATLVGLVALWPSSTPPVSQAISQQPVNAQVTATRAADCSTGSGDGGCVALIVHMTDGPRAGRDLVQVMPVEPGSPRFAVADEVVLGWSGADPDDPGSYQVVDFQRGSPLVWLAALFAGAVLLLGRWRGLAALAALALSFAVLLLFVLPSILSGHDPLAVAVVGSCLIMFVVLYLTHGPSARTSTAVLGTLLSLALIGGLGAAFSAAAKLTGLDDQTSNLIASLGTGVDARGLLLAGVVIGALGVLDDVTVTQTSAVWELRRADPELGTAGLFAAAMRIGRDHVASAVNTLVLAYAGASLPLLLLFTLSGRALGDVVTTQDVATEVVRTLVGSIGLVASVPITTALAAVVASREVTITR